MGTKPIFGGESPPSGSFEGVQPRVISSPKRGGAIRGIREKFAANPVTGTDSMTVPVSTSRGRSRGSCQREKTTGGGR